MWKFKIASSLFWVILILINEFYKMAKQPDHTFHYQQTNQIKIKNDCTNPMINLILMTKHPTNKKQTA